MAVGGVSQGKQLQTGWTGVTEGELRGDSFGETVVYIFLLVKERQEKEEALSEAGLRKASRHMILHMKRTVLLLVGGVNVSEYFKEGKYILDWTEQCAH